MIHLHLHHRQKTALLSKATEILFGGAAGGGKSHLIRAASIIWAAEIPGIQIYIFRRIEAEIISTHMNGPQGFRALLAPLANQGAVEMLQKEIRFKNGSTIFLCACHEEKDVYKYLSYEMHVLMIDELVTFTEEMYRLLRTRNRCVGLKIPDKYKGQFPKILCGTNPGKFKGWVKQAFIDTAPPMHVHRTTLDEGQMLRQFIPSLLEDNPSMAEYDPDYEFKLHGIGSEALVRAYRWGDWSAMPGSFFDTFEPRLHVKEPFIPPSHWLRWMALDWGYARPAAALWFTQVGDDYGVPDNIKFTNSRDQNLRLYKGDLPRGAIVVYREMYLSPKHNNVGLRKTPEEVATAICNLEADEPKNRVTGRPNIAARLTDSQLFNKSAGKSVAEQMSVDPYYLYFENANRRRVPQKEGDTSTSQQIRSRLRGEETGLGTTTPMLYIQSNCVDTVRTIPDMVEDEKYRERMLDDPNIEDHLVHCLGWGCMYREYFPALEEKKHKFNPTIFGINSTTMQLEGRDIDLFANFDDEKKKYPRHERIQ